MSKKVVRNLLLIAFMSMVYFLLPQRLLNTVQASPCCEELQCNGNFDACMDECNTLFPDGASDGFYACRAQCHNTEVACANRSCSICSWNPGPDPCGPYGLFCAPYTPYDQYGQYNPGAWTCNSPQGMCNQGFCGVDGWCYPINQGCVADKDCPSGMWCFSGSNTCIKW